jgi:hypothetical protein
MKVKFLQLSTYLPDLLDLIAQIRSSLEAYNFEIALLPNSAIALPNVPTDFQIFLRNIGSSTSTITLSTGALPATVQASFNQDTITLNPGESTQLPVVTLTQTGDNVIPFEFNVLGEISDPGALSLTRSAIGTFISRDESIQVFAVRSLPPFVQSGDSALVTARIVTALNNARSVKAFFRLKDEADQVVFTSAPNEIELGVDSALKDFQLGDLDTSGLINGLYRIEVEVL